MVRWLDLSGRQGLSQAVGMALGERLRGLGGRVYCLVSDGELQEGQVWEACMAAVEPVGEKLAAFGFAVRRVDANVVDDVLEAFEWARAQPGRPSALVCDNVPGKGVSSFEAYEKVHYVRAGDEVWARALEELG